MDDGDDDDDDDDDDDEGSVSKLPLLWQWPLSNHEYSPKLGPFSAYRTPTCSPSLIHNDQQNQANIIIT